MNVPSVEQQTALWRERLIAADIPPDGLMSHARVGARMVAGDNGRSRLGGTPRMPAGWSWPAWDGRPLQYLAQIDLDALARVLSEDQRHGLPAGGDLHLFTDALGEGGGSTLRTRSLPRHRVCGLPDIVQNPMELECQLASEGVYVGDPSGYQTPRARELEPGAKDWRLLAQIDSDNDLGLMWGDAGLVYWWLREADFRQGRPERCWGILHCS